MIIISLYKVQTPGYSNVIINIFITTASVKVSQLVKKPER